MFLRQKGEAVHEDSQRGNNSVHNKIAARLDASPPLPLAPATQNEVISG